MKETKLRFKKSKTNGDLRVGDKTLLVTSASLLVTSALLVVTMCAIRNKII